MVNAIRTNLGKSLLTAEDLTSKSIIFDKLQNSFAKCFNSGTINVKNVTNQLINENENDIVLPVAGLKFKVILKNILMVLNCICH